MFIMRKCCWKGYLDFFYFFIGKGEKIYGVKTKHHLLCSVYECLLSVNFVGKDI